VTPARALAAGALLLAACKPARPPCAPDLPSVVELRDGAGALELTLRRPPDSEARLDVCDAANRRLGLLHEATSPRSVTLRNAAGDPWARAAAPEREGADATLTLPSGALRLHRMGDLLRLLDPSGLPIGQLGPQGGRMVTFDGAGVPLAFTDTVEQRRIVHARDGAVRHYAVGIGDERAAAAFALERLEPAERVLLARFLDGGDALR
jgi:hypothetical protein